MQSRAYAGLGVLLAACFLAAALGPRAGRRPPAGADRPFLYDSLDRKLLTGRPLPDRGHLDFGLYRAD